MASTNFQEENESIRHTSVIVPEVLTAYDCQQRVLSPDNQLLPPAPDEDVSLGIPEISQPCVSLAEAAFTEFSTLNVEEALIREENSITSHDANSILDQDIPEEFALPFPDPASTLDIQGSARSDQGAQCTCSLPSSSEQLTMRAASSGVVQPPNYSYGGSTVNALADASLPSNIMGQNPPRHLFSDPYEYELEKLRREEEYLKKGYEETASELMAELERKMLEAQSNYDRESKELDAAYKAKAMEEEVNRSFVERSSLLANAFVSKFSERSESSDLAAIRAAVISQQLIQRQQAVETNTHVNSTAPPRPSVTAAEAQIRNPSGPRSYCNTTQPRPMSQQAAVRTNTHVNSTASSHPSVTTVEAPIPIPIPNLSGPRSHFTSQPRPLSQQPAVQSDTRMHPTVPPRPSITAAEPPVTNPLVPRVPFPRRNMTQQSLMSQQAVVQSNTNVNPTALARTLVTSEALPLHSPRTNTPRPRPPPVISNLTPSSSTAASSPSVHGIMRAPAPHLKSFRSSPAPISAAASTTTTHPPRVVQEQQQGNSKGGLVYLSDDDE